MRGAARRPRRPILAGAGLVVVVVVLVVPVVLVATRGEQAGQDGSGSVGAYQLRVGDCFRAPTQGQVREVERLPCDSPHTAEVLAVQTLPAGSWPGQAELDNLVEVACAQELRAYVEVEPVDSQLEVTWFAPTQDGWSRGDRELTCVAVADAPLTGSVRGSHR